MWNDLFPKMYVQILQLQLLVKVTFLGNRLTKLRLYLIRMGPQVMSDIIIRRKLDTDLQGEGHMTRGRDVAIWYGMAKPTSNHQKLGSHEQVLFQHLSRERIHPHLDFTFLIFRLCENRLLVF